MTNKSDKGYSSDDSELIFCFMMSDVSPEIIHSISILHPVLCKVLQQS